MVTLMAMNGSEVYKMFTTCSTRGCDAAPHIRSSVESTRADAGPKREVLQVLWSEGIVFVLAADADYKDRRSFEHLKQSV